MSFTNVASYRSRFHEPTFALDAAIAIAKKHGLPGAARRTFDGSNLVFAFDGCWMKICPPFWAAAYQAELSALKEWFGRLTVETPKLIAAGDHEGWRYLVTTHVAGKPYIQMRSSLTEGEHAALADDVGRLIGSLSHIGRLGLYCEGRGWREYAQNAIANAERIHLGRGCSADWSKRISSFLSTMKDIVLGLPCSSTVHADLNHAHLLFDADSSRLRGAIDFADAIDAPVEVDFLLPFLDCFRGSAVLQRRAIAASGRVFTLSGADFSNGLMALMLLNRFIRFDEWFDIEIARLATTEIEAIAAVVFPAPEK